MADYYVRVDDHTRVRREDCVSCSRCGELLLPGDSYHDLDGEALCIECWDALDLRTLRVVGDG